MGFGWDRAGFFEKIGLSVLQTGMHGVWAVLSVSWDLYVQMAPYLLLGLFFAGLMHVAIPLEMIGRHLGSNSFVSILKAVIFGIPLPLCSCGVIPAAVALRKKGASKAATLSFLIATPITGVDSIMATYSLMGPFFTVFRVVFASLTALVVGGMARLWLAESSPDLREKPVRVQDPADGHIHLDQEASRPRHSLWSFVSGVGTYGFGSLLRDLTPSMMVGIGIGGAVAWAMPDTWIQTTLGGGWLEILAMLILGIPMYVCATGSIPIAASFMFKGLSPGAAMVFLLVGPATNAVTMTVVTRELGKSSLILYLSAIAMVSVLAAMLMNGLWEAWNIPLVTPEVFHDHQTSLVFQISAWALLVLMARALFQRVRRRFLTQ
jgi:uncharacterized membrane protein YraQ (UPF0718 family)